MNNIPIVMIIDPEAIIPFVVAVRSISEATQSLVQLKVVGIDIDDEQKKLVYGAAEDNVDICYIDASSYLPEIKKYAGTHAHVSNAALLKFFLPEICGEYEKLLYMDVDVIVRRDLSELLNNNIDDVYAGVVENLVKVTDDSEDIIHKRGSFNSGVMLINCKKMRNDNICSKLLEAKKNIANDVYMDQTAFNIVLKDGVKLLPLRYNYLSLFDLHNIDVLNDYYGTKYESDEALCEDIAILHLAGAHKPWKYLNGYYSNMWWDICSRTSIKERVREETLPAFRGERRVGIFKRNYQQGIVTIGIGKTYFMAKFHDGVENKKRLFVSRNPVLKCVYRRNEG